MVDEIVKKQIKILVGWDNDKVVVECPKIKPLERRKKIGKREVERPMQDVPIALAVGFFYISSRVQYSIYVAVIFA